MFAWSERNHMDKQKFIDTYRSADVDARVKRAQELTDIYNISRIPAFVVDGKYLTTSGMAGSVVLLAPTVDKLIEKARADRAAKK